MWSGAHSNTKLARDLNANADEASRLPGSLGCPGLLTSTFELQDSMNLPNRNTIWRFAQCIGVDGAAALLQCVDAQLQRLGYIARGGQPSNATLVSAPRQHVGKEEERLSNAESPTGPKPSAGKRPGCHAHQETRQEPLWLQAQRKRLSQARLLPLHCHRHSHRSRRILPRRGNGWIGPSPSEVPRLFSCWAKVGELRGSQI